MKKFLYLIIFAIFISGCSSEPAANAPRTNASIAELNQPNENPYANSNKTGLEPQFLPMNKDDKPPVKGSGNTNAAPIIAKPLAYEAPDNSEIISSMNGQGQMVETRTFKGNPTLAKIERVYVELNKPVVKIYLKNGKTVDGATVKIDDPMKSSAEDIINAVSGGSKPAPTKQP